MCPPYSLKKGLTMEYEEAKEKIVEALTKKLKTKSKFYFNDLAKILGEKPRVAKKTINLLVQVKNTYDPTNLFRFNANVRPTV